MFKTPKIHIHIQNFDRSQSFFSPDLKCIVSHEGYKHIVSHHGAFLDISDRENAHLNGVHIWRDCLPIGLLQNVDVGSIRGIQHFRLKFSDHGSKTYYIICTSCRWATFHIRHHRCHWVQVRTKSLRSSLLPLFHFSQRQIYQQGHL